MIRKVTQAGFSLVEILIYLAIVGGLLLASTQLITSALTSRNRVTAQTAVAQNMRFAINKIGQEVRSAKKIDGETKFNQDQGKLVLGENGRFNKTIFTLVDGIIQLRQQGGDEDFSAVLTTDDVNVSVMRFQDVGAAKQEAIRVTLEISYRNPDAISGLESSSSESFTVTLRDISDDDDDDDDDD